MENPNIQKKPNKSFFFNKESDEKLKQYVAEYEGKDINWREIAKKMNLRTRQVKERYCMYLHEPLNSEPLSNQELVKLLFLQQIFGNKWSKIAENFGDRAPIILKNTFRKLARRGIDFHNVTTLLSVENSLEDFNYSVKRALTAKEKKERKEKKEKTEVKQKLPDLNPDPNSNNFFTFEGYMNIMGREPDIWRGL